MDDTTDLWTKRRFFGHINNREREGSLAEPAFQLERLVLTSGRPEITGSANSGQAF